MGFLLTFLEGIITFVSPCLLPMLPIYLAYFAGGGGEGPARTSHTLACTLAFVLGFTLPFVALGAFAGVLGSLVVAHQRALDVACGAVMVTLGLAYVGVLDIPALQRTVRPLAAGAPRGLPGSFVFGMAFAIGWSPCVGTFLASALSLAAASASAARGIALLMCYCAGLGVPFVLTALLIDQLEGALGWVRVHRRSVDRACGLLLVLVGALMATGTFGAWLRVLAM